MGIFYSASAHGFFDDSLCAALPDDALAISPDLHADLLAAQGDGGRIEADADGMPCIRRDTHSLLFDLFYIIFLFLFFNCLAFVLILC